MKRLFIAINLPDEIRSGITWIITRINADVRWLPPGNWHLTLVFLGYQPDEAIIPILESIKQTVKKFPASEIDPHTKRGLALSAQKDNYPRYGVGVEFEKIILAPPNKPPRMIWLTTAKETSKKLNEIKIELEDNLIKNGVRFKIDNRPFNGHLTLARFPSILRMLNVPNLDIQHLNINFVVQSLDLMESYLKRTGAEYEVLSKFDFIE